MNLTLKNLKINKNMSEETTCFSATLYVDGKKAASVSNHGCGGPNEYYWYDNDLGSKVEDWAKKQPLEFDFEHLDQIVDVLMDKAELRSKLVRATKKETLFCLKTDEKGNWRTIKSPFSPSVEEFINKKYGDAVACIANKDIEKAIDFC